MLAALGVNPVALVYDGRDPYQAQGDDAMELAGPAARYEQVAAQLRHAIYSREYDVGQALPSEADLAAELGVSRPLINRALQVLAAEQLVSQEQGRGTFVQPRRLYG